MEASAPKRRRTSPRNSTPAADNNNTATPERGGADPDSQDRPLSQSPRRKRPDFASPTRASLARHNPEILARRPARQRPPPPTLQPSTQLREQEDGASSQPLATQLSRPDIPDDLPASRPASRESDISLSELLTAQLDNRPSEPPSRGFTAKPRRSPIKPILPTRPLPPPAADEEELIDPFKRRPRIRRSGEAQPVAQNPEPGPEPELPPTPTEKGIVDTVVTAPPLGIHSSSSPSKRWQAAKEKRRAQGRPLISSPLKKPPLAPVAAPPADEGRDPLTNPQKTPEEEELQSPHARGAKPFDEIREKEDYLERLKKDASDLWDDINMMTGFGQESGVNARQILPLVRKHPSFLEQPEPDAEFPDGTLSKALLQSALNPSAWLPFSSRIPDPPAQPDKAHDDLPAPKSHHPLPMTAEEELPFLQMFSPFTFTSTNTPLSQDDMDAYVQHHDISIRATDAPVLFSARISIVVDLRGFEITSLKVTRLDPNAEAELAPYIKDILTRPGRAMTRNVSLVMWAMGEWYRTAVKRAQFWHELYSEMRVEGRARENVGKLWGHRSTHYNREAEETIDDTLVDGKDYTMRDILPYMGTVAATVPIGLEGDDGVMMRLTWKISFDSVGDAQSKVNVVVGMPGHWHKRDTKGALAGIPKIFYDLVLGTSNVKAAVRRVIALVADRDE